MQELVRVSSMERTTLSLPCRVRVRSSTSDGVLVYSTRLVLLIAQRLMWFRGYFWYRWPPSWALSSRPSRPIWQTTRSERWPSSGTRLT